MKRVTCSRSKQAVSVIGGYYIVENIIIDNLTLPIYRDSSIVIIRVFTSNLWYKCKVEIIGT